MKALGSACPESHVSGQLIWQCARRDRSKKHISGNRVYQELGSAQQLSALHEFVLSLNEVSQVRNSYNVLRLLVHIDEPQLTILPFGGQIDAHQHSETKTIQVGHVF